MVNQRGIEAKLEKIEAICKMRGLPKPEKAPRAGPLLSKSKPDEILQLYLVVSNKAISAVLIREERTTQLLIYYTSKALLSLETRYPDMQKLVLALITASKKLRPHFQAHTIHVLTNFSLRQGQALADFMAKFANLPKVDEIMEQAEPPTWNLFIDGSAGDAGSGARVVLISLEGHKLNSTVRFGFKATNNIAEYEALLAGLRLAREMQVDGNFSAKDKRMASYLKMVMNFILSFEKFELIQIPTSKMHMQMHSPNLKGYYWPTLERDALEFVRKCNKCQRLSLIQRKPLQDLTAVSSPWPFSKWGVDLIGPLPKGRGCASFAIVAIDCFTKWVEAESLAKIIEANTSKFLWKNIICRFEISYSIVSDNGRQFDNNKVRSLCEEFGIKKHFSTPHHPQANGQVEAVNKTIKHVLKRKFNVSKGACVDELP
ncbi:uncharacterized protein LOC111374967 [Olea europaea var. sylvestris]|uniref:uncharacterized protein LOC111374967 n=1 Tax=Olea europaea var. sylvestris TaxID=158386 RepID=UPI000C1CCD4B|nr:uncharacterized protein LOC111374967 [Olea europaea var. sylvestris]